MSKSSGHYQNGNDYEIVGCIGNDKQLDEKQESDRYFTLIRNEKDGCWLRYNFLIDNSSIETIQIDDIENDSDEIKCIKDKRIDLVIYKKK